MTVTDFRFGSAIIKVEIMSSGAGSNALMALKSKMQSLREELDKAHDQVEAKSREFEAERENRTQVI